MFSGLEHFEKVFNKFRDGVTFANGNGVDFFLMLKSNVENKFWPFL
jgi:hypothetical protein